MVLPCKKHAPKSVPPCRPKGNIGGGRVASIASLRPASLRAEAPSSLDGARFAGIRLLPGARCREREAQPGGEKPGATTARDVLIRGQK